MAKGGNPSAMANDAANAVTAVVQSLMGGVREAAASASSPVAGLSAGVKGFGAAAGGAASGTLTLTASLAGFVTSVRSARPPVLLLSSAVSALTRDGAGAEKVTTELATSVGRLAGAAVLAEMAVSGLVDSLLKLAGGGKSSDGGLATTDGNGSLVRRMTDMMRRGGQSGLSSGPSVTVGRMTIDKPGGSASSGGGGAGGGVNFGQMAQGVRAFAAVVGAVVTQVVALARRIASASRAYVEAFRPDVVKRFDIAAKDFTAVIGRSLVPVLQLATVISRELGGMLKGVLAALKPFTDIVMRSLNDLFKSLAETAKKFMADGLTPLLPVLEQVAKYVQVALPMFAGLAAVFGDTAATVVQLAAALMGFQSALLNAILPVVGVVLKVVGALLKVILVPFKSLAAVLGPLVQIALHPLTTVLKVLTAVVDTLLTPVMELADAWAEVGGEIAALIGDVIQAFQDFGAELMEVLGGLISPALDLVKAVVKGVVGAIKTVVVWIRTFIDSIRSILGLPGDKVGPKSNVGEAARSANFTSAEEAWKRIVESTASSGRGAAVSAQEKTATATQNLWRWFDQNKDKIGRFLDRADTAGNGTGKVVTGAANVLAPIPSFILDAFRSTVLR